MLWRFVPLHVREPDFEIEEVHPKGPVSRGALAGLTVAAIVVGFATAALLSALLDASKAMRGVHRVAFDLEKPLLRLLSPSTPAQWLALAGPVLIALLCGVAAAGLIAARRGVRREGD
jgi:PAT family beta-lactamase induction signal transducer AmpG